MLQATSQRQELSREIFKTSRLMDFFSVKELTAQVGHPERDWPLVAIKELLDNALDACEDTETAPVIHVTADGNGIEVTDNGPGLPSCAIDAILDFSVRVSSREAYVSPARGAQGNALKTLIAMPFVLDKESGTLEIGACGARHTITCMVDRLQQKPVIHRHEESVFVKNGTSIKVHWPDSASSILQEARPRILQMVLSFAVLNPHLTLTLDLFGEAHRWSALDSQWRKWKANEPTSPHWYNLEALKRLIAAYIAHDGSQGRERTVREFISEFRGLTSTAKQKAVLKDVALSRQPLAVLVKDGALDDERIAALLAAMRAHSVPVKPQVLGVVGKEHFKTRLAALGGEMDTFKYVCERGETDGLPWVIETAFVWTPDTARRLIAGVNFSPGIVNPFREFGPYGMGLEAVLEQQRSGRGEPVALVVHMACPRVNYSDRGKSAVVMGGEHG
jgi:DNA topoisomerase VI subunit B